MIRLIRKELWQLLPIAYLWLAVLLLGYVVQALTERIDEETFGSWCEGYCDINSSALVAVFSILFALVTAYSLFPREHDDSTVDFLRALPVSRVQIFSAKVLAGWFLLLLVNLLSYGIDALLLSSNPQSISGSFYPQVWATLLWRDAVFAFIILSHGIILSWFRTLGLVIYAVYLLLLMLFESRYGSAGNFSVFQLLSNEYHGSVLLVDKQALIIHLLVACVLLLLAYRLWNNTDSAQTGGRQRKRGGWLWRSLAAIGGFVVLAGVLALQINRGTGGVSELELAVVATDHYRMVYKKERAETVQYVAEHADADLVRLGDILGVASLPSIRVDMSAHSDHAAGLAKWKKIQMDLDSFTDDISQRRVLSHESAHVLQAIESRRALSRNNNAVNFFIEGMAQYLSFVIVPETARREQNWQLAAIAWQRQDIRFEDLINAAEFARQFDPELHYSLGDLWTEALVNTCGEEVLGNFLRAAGRDDAPRDVAGMVFWRDTSREIACELDAVNNNWRELMQDIVATVDPLRFPEYADVVIRRDQDGRQIIVEAALQPFGDTDEQIDTAAMRFALRIASSAQLSATVNPVIRGVLIDDGGSGNRPRIRFGIPEQLVLRNRFRYQLGLTPQAGSRFYYETWQNGSARQ